MSQPTTIRVVARSKNEVLLKLYLDERAYNELLEHARPLCVSVLDLVRAIIADRFPQVPTEELRVGGVEADGLRAPKPLMDNREGGDVCKRPGCGHNWGAHNEGAQGDELPDGGLCIECAVRFHGARLTPESPLNCERFV